MSSEPTASTSKSSTSTTGQKRSRDSISTSDVPKKSTNSSRRIDSVIYSGYEIQAEFHSPYPFEEPILTTGTNTTGTVGDKKGIAAGGGVGNKSRNGSKEAVQSSNTKGKGNGKNKVALSSSTPGDKGKRKESPLVPKNNNNNNNSSFPSDLLNDPPLVLASRVPPLPLHTSPISIPNLLTSNFEPSASLHRTRRTSSSSTPSTSKSIRGSPIFTSTNVLPHPPATLLLDDPSPDSSSPYFPGSTTPSANSKIRSRRTSLQELDLKPLDLGEVESKSTPVEKGIGKGKGKGKERMEMEMEDMDLDEDSLPTASNSLSTNTKKNVVTLKSSTGSTTETKDAKIRRLFVCDYCFKYMLQGAACTSHMKQCTFTHPPGKRVYNRGAHTIWEIDGATAKLYCQNLCLFAKLFIEHKYMFFDVEGFLFYVITDATPSHDYVLGYFSKEKMSYDDYNLACIVTFPPFQKQAWGSLLIEFSYELTRKHSLTPGTPERPLSELGLRGYLTYWTSTLVRYFRTIFEAGGPKKEILVAASGKDSILAKDEGEEGSTKKKQKKSKNGSKGFAGELTISTTSISVIPDTSISLTNSTNVESGSVGSPRSTTLTLRRSANGIASASFQPPSSPISPLTTPSSLSTLLIGPSAPSTSGWARPGSQSVRFVLKPSSSRTSSPGPTSSTKILLDPVKVEEKDIELVDPSQFTLRTGLKEISEAVNLRIEDVAFALVESGLASWRRREMKGNGTELVLEDVDMQREREKVGGGGGEGVKDLDEIVISLELVEEVAKKFKVKAPLLDKSYVLI